MLTMMLDEWNDWFKSYWKTYCALVGFCLGLEGYFILGIVYHLVTGY